jgi:hypothetical protein
MTMRWLPWLLWLAACGTTGDTTEMGENRPEQGSQDPGDGPQDPGDGSANSRETLGRLHGSITRSVEPQAGGVGHIYLAVFDKDPVIEAANVQLIALAVVEDADLSQRGAAAVYEIASIPPRADAYFVTAFLDDNNSVDASSAEAAGPDKGDLVSLIGFASPSVVVSTPGERKFDIDLNTPMPF